MSQQIEYKTVVGGATNVDVNNHGTGNFDYMVKQAIADGWRPAGGIAAIKCTEYDYRFYQPMIRENRK